MADSEESFAVFCPSKRAWMTAVFLFGMEGWVSGQGFLAMGALVFGLPLLAFRAWRVRADRRLYLRRLSSAGVIAVASGAAILMVRADMKGAHQRAENLIAACESFRSAKGMYPEKLESLVPDFVSTIPHARLRGSQANRDFRYFVAGPNTFVRSTNVHVLVYTAVPPFGRAYYVFEERRWGSYD